MAGSVTSIGDEAFSLCYGLSSVYFLGNAPKLGSSVFAGIEEMTVYYQPFTTGWTNTFGGYATTPWIPSLPAPGITIYSNQPVLFIPLSIIGTNYVLQMSTNLTSGNWVTVSNGTPIIGVEISTPTNAAFFRIQ